MRIKKSLEKNSGFEGSLKDVEELINQFDIASQRFKSNKATILFTKVTDK